MSLVSPPRRPNAHRRPARAIRRGFTLVEILVVVTIIALIAGLVVPQLFGRIAGSKQKIAQAEVASIAQQVSTYMFENGMSSLPDDFSLSDLTIGEDRYLNEDDLLDPWDRAYIVVVPGDVNPKFDVMSYGADGEPGGEGENEDVVH